MEELKAMPDIVAIPILKSVGSTIKSTGSFDQVFASVHFVFDNKEELKQMVNIIHSTLKVFDENGINMIRKMVNIQDMINNL